MRSYCLMASLSILPLPAEAQQRTDLGTFPPVRHPS